MTSPSPPLFRAAPQDGQPTPPGPAASASNTLQPSQQGPQIQTTGEEEPAQQKGQERQSQGQPSQEDGRLVNEQLEKCPLLRAAVDIVQTETSYQIRNSTASPRAYETGVKLTVIRSLVKQRKWGNLGRLNFCLMECGLTSEIKASFGGREMERGW